MRKILLICVNLCNLWFVLNFTSCQKKAGVEQASSEGKIELPEKIRLGAGFSGRENHGSSYDFPGLRLG